MAQSGYSISTSPNPVQSSSLAVDISGEVIVAGLTDSFEIFHSVVHTNLAAHEEPLHSLAISL
jgi:periodic tryptophan protein 2